MLSRQAFAGRTDACPAVTCRIESPIVLGQNSFAAVRLAISRRWLGVGDDSAS